VSAERASDGAAAARKYDDNRLIGAMRGRRALPRCSCRALTPPAPQAAFIRLAPRVRAARAAALAPCRRFAAVAEELWPLDPDDPDEQAHVCGGRGSRCEP
jgi:hypothetical protein